MKNMHEHNKWYVYDKQNRCECNKQNRSVHVKYHELCVYDKHHRCVHYKHHEICVHDRCNALLCTLQTSCTLLYMINIMKSVHHKHHEPCVHDKCYEVCELLRPKPFSEKKWN